MTPWYLWVGTSALTQEGGLGRDGLRCMKGGAKRGVFSSRVPPCSWETHPHSVDFLPPGSP